MSIQAPALRVFPVPAADPALALAGARTPELAVVDSLAGLRALGAEWRRLEEEAAASFNFFQSFDWTMAWAERFLGGPGAPRIKLVTGREGGRLRMIWPLMVSRTGPIRTLKWLTEPFLQYGGVLVGAVDRAAWLEAGWRYILGMTGIDAIALRRVRADDPVAGLLGRVLSASAERRVTCFIDLGRHASHDALLAALPSRRRQLRRKLRAKLEAAGSLEYRVLPGGPEVATVIGDAMRLKRQWLQDTGNISKALTDPRIDGLFLALSAAPAGTPRVSVGVLNCAGRPISYEIAFHYRRHHFLYVIASDPAFSDLSPSKVQIDDAQAWGIANGIATFDMLPPADRYKLDLSDQTVEVLDYFGATNVLGKVYGAYLARIRPPMKALYLRRAAPWMAWLRGRDPAPVPARDNSDAN